MDGVQQWIDEGIGHKAAGRLGEAARAFEQALAIDGHHAAAYFHLGSLAENLGQCDSAVSLYLQAIELDPQQVRYQTQLGDLFLERGNCAAAEKCYLSALELLRDGSRRPLIIAILNQLGMALLRQEKLDAAAEAFRRILALSPGFAEVHNNLAFVLERQGQLEAALAAAQKCVELKPDYPEGFNNLGVALRALHRLDEARAAFRHASELRPDFALAHFNHGTICLLAGDYRAGWAGYEWRNLTLPRPPRKFSVPRWDGRRIESKTLLVHAEQGYGDDIQFARFLPLAKELSGANILLEGPRDLLPLLRSVAGVDVCVAAGSDLPAYDFEIALPSLPGVLQIELSSLPANVPYVMLDDAKRAEWRERLNSVVGRISNPSETRVTDGLKIRSTENRRIGIVWQGNPAQSQDVVRSCGLGQFTRLRDVPGITWFGLQKGEFAESQIARNDTGLDIIPLGPYLHDFADTAAAICELDLVITVDTSVAHLAGALGRPVWTLLCHTPDWRWHLNRTDSPWYPTMRLFRQPTWGDWPAVFDEVAHELNNFRMANQ